MIRLLPALAVVALATAGCGSEAVADDPVSLDEVARATQAQPYRFEVTVAADGLREAFHTTAKGATDPGSDRSTVRYEFTGGEEMTLEVRRIGATSYTRFTAPGMPAGWSEEASGDLSELSAPFGAFSDPGRALTALARHGRDVETSPGKEVDGVPTARYRATVPLIELFGSDLDEQERKELEAEIRETSGETAEVQAWAGADGLLRELAFAFPIEEDGRKGRVESTSRFFDFGEPVAIEAPPRSEIDGPGALEGIGAGAACEGPASPHRPQAVVAALRGAGFETTATCLEGDTTILAFPKGDGREQEAVFCSVRGPRGAGGIEGPPEAVVAGNVTCYSDSGDVRRLLQRLLGSL